MEIVDAQVHIWELDRPDRPWPSGRFVPPWALKPFSKGQLLEEMDKAGVTRVFLVPPSWEGDRNDLALEAARLHPNRFAVVGRLPLDNPKSKGLLPRWKDNINALGLRFTFFIPQQKKWLHDGTADWLWAAAEDAKIPLMIYPTSDTLPLFGEIAARHPDLRITIDHLAIGHEDWNRDDRAFEHLDMLLNLARYPNVAVKASGLPEYSTEEYPYRNLHKYVRAVVEEFSPKRVFWGTDLTRLPCTYSQAISMFTEEMPWLSADDKNWIMGRAICEWHGWR
jgi:L-fuconolactonase